MKLPPNRALISGIASTLFIRSFVFMYIAGCTCIFVERGAGNGTRDAGQGTRDTGHGARDTGSRTGFLLTSTLLTRIWNHRWQIPRESVSTSPLGIFPFLCFHEHRRMHLHFVKRKTRDTGTARLWIGFVPAGAPPARYEIIDRIFALLCFHQHRRMHLHFCETGQGTRGAGRARSGN